MGLQGLKDMVSISIYGMTAGQAQKEGICISCKEPAIGKCYSPAGVKEFHISGLCELCFDRICGEEE